MKTRVIAGRAFEAGDNAQTSTSVLVDRVFAAKVWPGQPAVGKRVFVRFRGNDPEWFDVIGVVDHQRNESLAKDGRETIFFNDGQIGGGAFGRWAVRTNGDPGRLAPLVRAAVREVDPLTPVAEVKPMTEYLAAARVPTRFALTLIGVFAGMPCCSWPARLPTAVTRLSVLQTATPA